MKFRAGMIGVRLYIMAPLGSSHEQNAHKQVPESTALCSRKMY
jgi:hypothetical protein